MKPYLLRAFHPVCPHHPTYRGETLQKRAVGCRICAALRAVILEYGR